MCRPMGSFAVQMEEWFKIPKSTNSSSFPVYEISTIPFAEIYLLFSSVCQKTHDNNYLLATHLLQIF